MSVNNKHYFIFINMNQIQMSHMVWFSLNIIFTCMWILYLIKIKPYIWLFFPQIWDVTFVYNNYIIIKHTAFHILFHIWMSHLGIKPLYLNTTYTSIYHKYESNLNIKYDLVFEPKYGPRHIWVQNPHICVIWYLIFGSHIWVHFYQI